MIGYVEVRNLSSLCKFHSQCVNQLTSPENYIIPTLMLRDIPVVKHNKLKYSIFTIFFRDDKNQYINRKSGIDFTYRKVTMLFKTIV